jgi:hypothetical protein
MYRIGSSMSKFKEERIKRRFVMTECESIIDGADGFSVNVRDYEGSRYNLSWKDGVVSYRNTDEGDRINFVAEVSSKSLVGFLLIECVHSKFIKWLSAEKYGIEQKGLRHFIVMTSNDIIDVIDYDLPTVSKLNS